MFTCGFLPMSQKHPNRASHGSNVNFRLLMEGQIIGVLFLECLKNSFKANFLKFVLNDNETEKKNVWSDLGGPTSCISQISTEIRFKTHWRECGVRLRDLPSQTNMQPRLPAGIFSPQRRQTNKIRKNESVWQ